MNNDANVLLIDAGNTAVKVAEFTSDQIVNTQRMRYQEFHSSQIRFLQSEYQTVVISSVLNEKDNERYFGCFEDVVFVDFSSLPFQMNYKTPDTLGQDRICNGAYLTSKKSSETMVAIDIGTCIKFDVIHQNAFVGGSISPGIDLRYRALSEFTGRLPHLESKERISIVGNSTNENILSGVLNGIQEEINGFIRRYEAEYSDLTFFMTGGDAQYFDIHSKNDIFAVENLTLLGLYEIYKHNA